MSDILGDFLRGAFPPTSATVRKTDEAMAHTARNECPFCYAPMDEEGFCSNKECR